MLVITIAVSILAAPFILKWHLTRRIKGLRLADRVWGSLEQHAHALMQDKTLPPVVGDSIEMVIHHAGNGSLTRSFLVAQVLRMRASEKNELAAAVRRLNRGQTIQIRRFLLDALLYDSLRTTVSGAIVRHLNWWILPTARDESQPVSEPQALPIAAAAERAYHHHCTIAA